ncbi:MAG: two-component system, OmpR family, sensor kinase [Acidimicrobiaceae bacterium]|nr:two-component system, OmpR family, sensor kinase [Acidimicrobiaceae bacterium]
MPIRLRLAGLFALGTAALIAVTGFVFADQLRSRLVHSVDSGLRGRAALVAASVAGGNLRQTTDGGPAPLGGSLTQVYDATGALVGASDDVPERILSVDEVGAVRNGTVEDRTLGDRSIRLRLVPVRRSGSTWLVAVGASTEGAHNAAARVRHAIEFGGPPAVLLAGLAAWLVAGGALRPVERMRREVAEISEHGASAAIVVPGTHDEIANLAATMNDVLGQLKRALDRERRFVTDAGHELRTPLTILQAELELAGRPGRSREELAAAVESATGEVRRLAALAEDLLALGRDASVAPRHEPVPLTTVVHESATAFEPRATAAGVRIRCEIKATVVVTGDAAQLRRAVDNLVDNALHFAPAQSEITVTVDRTGNTTSIEVADEGPGFPEDFLPDAFERFRRADAARTRRGGGTGLGLALVRAVADAHGGRAVAGNRPTGGASVRLELPCPSLPHPHEAGITT